MNYHVRHKQLFTDKEHLTSETSQEKYGKVRLSLDDSEVGPAPDLVFPDPIYLVFCDESIFPHGEEGFCALFL